MSGSGLVEILTNPLPRVVPYRALTNVAVAHYCKCKTFDTHVADGTFFPVLKMPA